jgi:drug/metabolite transporter (DMT)-like permease
MYVVLTPLVAVVLFRSRIRSEAWIGTAIAIAGLALLSGVHAGSAAGDLLVLAGAATYALQIVLMERYAPRYDPLALTLVEMGTACASLAVVGAARAEIGVPRGWTVRGALIVTGVFASALAYLFQSWAQRRLDATRTALLFSPEPVFAGLFGFALAGDRLGLAGWTGCVVILAGILVAEPAAADVLRRVIASRG